MSKYSNFYVLVQVEDSNEVNFWDFDPPMENPLVDGVNQALKKLGSTVKSGRPAPVPRIYPPFAGTMIEADPSVNDDDLKNKLDEIWPTLKDNKGASFPNRLRLNVNGQED